MFNEVSEEVAKVLAASKKVILEQATSTQPTTGTVSPTRNANTKIDDTLKPRQELLRSFTLEEANIWFDGFKAYFNHNEKVIEKLPPSVRRQILNNSIEAGRILISVISSNWKSRTEFASKGGTKLAAPRRNRQG